MVLLPVVVSKRGRTGEDRGHLDARGGLFEGELVAMADTVSCDKGNGDGYGAEEAIWQNLDASFIVVHHQGYLTPHLG